MLVPLMRALVGYAMLFMAIGLIVSYFISGFGEFMLLILLLIGAYVLLCRC